MERKRETSDMNQKTVLITGAGGYIGHHVVKEFLDRGCRVVASDFIKKGIDDRAEFTDIPIFSGAPNIYEQLGKPDVLVHLAWRDGFIHNSPAHMEDLSKHVMFLNRMIDGGLPVLSVMGSMHEVGYWEGAITASTPCMPQSQYGIAKNALRQSLLLYAQNKSIALRWLRAYYIYGDDTHGSSIFAKLTQAVSDGKKTFPFTSGKNKYDFIHVEELARQIAAATLQEKENGVINVCTGEPKTLANQVEWYIRENHFDIELEYGAFPDRPYDSPGVWGDAKTIQSILKAEERKS